MQCGADECSRFEATSAKLLRAAVSALYDLLQLATRALEQFSEPPMARVEFTRPHVEVPTV